MKCRCCKQEIPEELIEEEQPKIVGYTTKEWSYQRHHPILIGSPIWEFENYIFVEHTLIHNNEIEKVRFYKKELENL